MVDKRGKVGGWTSDARLATLRRRQEAELKEAEMKMLKFSLVITRMERIRNNNMSTC